jgi:hypothetical protein
MYSFCGSSAARLTNIVERNVQCAREAIAAILRRKANINPDCAVPSMPAASSRDLLLQQWRTQQLVEIVFREAQQHAIGLHHHGGIARGVGDQGLFAERIALLEFGKLNRRPGDLASDLAAPAFDQVVIVARLALLDDRVTTLHGQTGEFGQQGLDIRRGQRSEYAHRKVVEANMSDILRQSVTRWPRSPGRQPEPRAGSRSIRYRACPLREKAGRYR